MTKPPPTLEATQQTHDVTVAAMLKLADIKAGTPYQRRLVGMYSRAVIELVRCAIDLEHHNEQPIAATLARYASEVTNIACEHVRMSGEIHEEPK